MSLTVYQSYKPIKNNYKSFFNLILMKAFFSLTNHALTHSWKQPVLANICKVSCSRKHLTPGRQPSYLRAILYSISLKTIPVSPLKLSFVFYGTFSNYSHTIKILFNFLSTCNCMSHRYYSAIHVQCFLFTFFFLL